MDYEYVALSCWDITGLAVDEHCITQYASLQSQGWEEFIRAPWQIGREHASGAVVMRRPIDEPRKWTKAEIEKIAVMSQSGPRADGGWLGPTSSDSVLNERVMQADLIGRLERRNAELQAAIDKVVAISKQPRPHGAVRRLLWALATKEETNG